MLVSFTKKHKKEVQHPIHSCNVKDNNGSTYILVCLLSKEHYWCIVNNKSFKEEILDLPTSSTCPLSSFIYRLWNASSVFSLFCLLSQGEEEEEEEEEDGWKSSRNPAEAQETHRTELRSDLKRLNFEQCFSSSWALRGQIIHPCASPLLLALKISSLSLPLSLSLSLSNLQT